MAYNPGFSNLALAIGVIVGVFLVAGDGDTQLVGRTLIIFGTACVALVGAILASTGSSFRRAAAVQFVPAAVALVLAIAA
jgi:putative membrane protein